MNECLDALKAERQYEQEATDEDEMGAEFVEKAKMKFGMIYSPEWMNFTLEIIEHVCKKQTYINEDGSIDNFECTAGGCDEVIWYIAEDIIQETVLAYPTE